MKKNVASVRADKTLIDYLAIAICPVLIMVLVGSLVFFCLEVGYAGRYGGNLRWTLFWFVLAMVLVSRIAMERGSGHASVYGLALAAATGLMTSRMVTPILGFWVLLGLTWWCCHQLTWDCTLIDEDVDASGEGLLDAASLEKSTAPVPSAAPRPGAKKGAAGLVARWQRWQLKRAARARRTHAPGLWVVYFSLAALPVFGLGQTLLPSGNIDGRRFAFALLWLYVASALGLLLITSFLGLRRYLRQSNLQMQPAMAATWLGFGSSTAITILLFAVLLPRPDADYSMFRLIDRIGSVPQRASDHAVLRSESGEGKGREISSEQKAEGTKRRAGSGTDGDPSKKPQKDGRETDQPADEKKPGPSSNAGPDRAVTKAVSMGGMIANVVRWIVRVVIALIVLWLLVRYWRQLWQFLGQLWQELRNILAGLFSRSSAPSRLEDPQTAQTAARSPRMAAFENPFLNGAAQRITTAELVRYSFEALQAWAGDRGWPRRVEETPMEFVRQFAQAAPDLEDDARTLTRFYVCFAYGHRPLSDDCTPALERLWQKLTV